LLGIAGAMAVAARRVYTPEDNAASAPVVGATRDIDDPVKFNKVLSPSHALPLVLPPLIPPLCLPIGRWPGLRQVLDQLPSVDVMLDNNWTLLVYACTNGNVDAARTLLKRGANPDHVTKDCTSPLIAAATKGNVLLVDLLLEHNANVNVDAYGVTPLIAACANGRTAVVWKLLESDADVNLGTVAAPALENVWGSSLTRPVASPAGGRLQWALRATARSWRPPGLVTWS